MVQLTSLLLAALTSYSSLASAHKISAWSSTKFTGKEFANGGTGTFNLGFKAKSYKWDSPPGDGCCIEFCNGDTPKGNWCSTHSNSNVAAANQFNKVVVGCGGTVLNC